MNRHEIFEHSDGRLDLARGPKGGSIVDAEHLVAWILGIALGEIGHA